jgi:protein-arginine kinase
MMGSKRSYRRIAAELPRWLSNEGPEGDVVLSTRLHLSRNCQDFCFPSMMESAEKIEILRRSEEAVREMEGEYRALELASLDEIKRLLLTEQLYLPGSQADPDEIGPGTRLWLSGDGGSALLLNWEDHIRLSEIAPGFEIAESYRRLEAADSVLERYFPMPCPWSSAICVRESKKPAAVCGPKFCCICRGWAGISALTRWWLMPSGKG